MPCDSSHMEPNNREKELSKVFALLDEYESGGELNLKHYNGYHPSVYPNRVGKEVADQAVASLCEKLRGGYATNFSLEMQIWWRDHERVDMERIEKVRVENEEFLKKAQALAKLTEEDRQILGL